MLELRSIDKQFNNCNVKTLSGINITIKQGEFFGVIGRSGAGKSTLVRCMNLLETPTGGSVVFNNTDLTKLPKSELRKHQRKIGMIFQQFNLLEQRDALANVSFPLKISGVKREDAEKKAAELLHVVGLGDKLHSYPSQLSGGQKQRVAIARALVNEPQILLCDEATSALDPETRNSILKLLEQINKNLKVTVVIITHELSIVKAMCSRVGVLEKGKICEMGNVGELFENPSSDTLRGLLSEQTNDS